MPWVEIYAVPSAIVTGESGIVTDRSGKVTDESGNRPGSVTFSRIRRSRSTGSTGHVRRIQRSRWTGIPNGVSVAFQIILDEIAAVVEEVNAQGAAFMMNSDYPKAQAAITSGRKLSSFGEKLESLRQEWIAGLDEPTRAQVRIEPASVAHSIASAPKSPKTVLVVKFPDGTVIYEATAAATYVKTLKKLGLSRVGGLGIQINNHPLVSKERSSTYTQTEIDGYLVMTHSNTENKRKQLENIAAQLKVELAVDVVPAKDG